MEKIKVICFGVRKYEEEYFHNLNKYKYELVLSDSFVIDDTNIQLAKNCQVIMVRENVFLNEKYLKVLKEYGVKYLLTRTTGFDHIDLENAQKLEFHSLQRVPEYSTNAIGELSVSLAMTLLRKVQFTTNNTAHGDYTIHDLMLSKEIRECIVGIIGTGKIGATTAKLFHGLGAKIIAYDPYPNDNLKDIIEYVDIKTLMSKADVISIHSPLTKETTHLINKKTLATAKKDVIIINVARGPIVHTDDMLEFLSKNPKAAYGTDVLEGEATLFFKNYDKNSPSELKNIEKFYPQVLLTPHVGALTTRALTETIAISYDNLNAAINNQELKNNLFKK